MNNCGMVVDALQDLKICPGLTEGSLAQILEDWSLYSDLLSKISKELKVLAKLDEVITPLEKDEDPATCFMEISCLLAELGCPYLIITEGNISARFDTSDKRLLVLSFLLSELQASQMQYVTSPNASSVHMEIKLEESEQAKLLREILQCLDFSKPPDGIDIATLCRKIQERTGNIKEKLKESGVDAKPIFSGNLTENHWRHLEKFNKELYSEYKLRREMLLKRLDVTIQSFQWTNTKTDKLVARNQAIAELFQVKRAQLNPKPSIVLSELLAAREDLVYFEKTSSGSTRENTKSEVNRVRIGMVPDRGGRPSEAQAPPPEMPPWQQRQGQPAGGSGSRGSVGWTRGGRGGRGGESRDGGNWNQGGGNRGGYREAQGGGRYNEGGHGYGRGDGFHQGQQAGSQYQNDNFYGQDPYNMRGQECYNRGRGHQRGSYDRQPPRVQSGWHGSRN